MQVRALRPGLLFIHINITSTLAPGDLVLLTRQTLALLTEITASSSRQGLSPKGKTAPVEIYAPAVASGR
jgi:hypothetical protein